MLYYLNVVSIIDVNHGSTPLLIYSKESVTRGLVHTPKPLLPTLPQICSYPIPTKHHILNTDPIHPLLATMGKLLFQIPHSIFPVLVALLNETQHRCTDSCHASRISLAVLCSIRLVSTFCTKVTSTRVTRQVHFCNTSGMQVMIPTSPRLGRSEA